MRVGREAGLGALLVLIAPLKRLLELLKLDALLLGQDLEEALVLDRARGLSLGRRAPWGRAVDWTT